MIHERKILVQRPQCSIARCSCGVYHVSTGSVTLRLTQPQLEDVFRALTAVLGRQDEPSAEEPAIH